MLMLIPWSLGKNQLMEVPYGGWLHHMEDVWGKGRIRNSRELRIISLHMAEMLLTYMSAVAQSLWNRKGKTHKIPLHQHPNSQRNFGMKKYVCEKIIYEWVENITPHNITLCLYRQRVCCGMVWIEKRRYKMNTTPHSNGLCKRFALCIIVSGSTAQVQQL